MLRVSATRLWWAARKEVDQYRPMLMGRARMERRLGYKQIMFQLRTQCKFRVESKPAVEKQLIRAQADAAAKEQNTDWNAIRNDIARQKVQILPQTQATLAKYEPMAYRAMIELLASGIPPPPKPEHNRMPVEAVTNPGPHVAEAELDEAITRLQRTPSTISAVAPADLKSSWKRYLHADDLARA